MPESASARMAILAGGVSTQKAELRSPGQVEDALNIDFGLKFGSARRAGTIQLAALGTSLPASVWLASRPIEGGEQPRISLGSDGTIRLFDESWVEKTVQVDPAITSYLSASATSRHTCAGVDDGKGVLRIFNPSVIPLATASPVVLSQGGRDIYSALEAYTPTVPGLVYQAKEGSDGRPAGLYRYLPGIGTFATAKFAIYNASDTTGSPTTLLNHINQNPRGFRLFSSRYLVNTVVAVYATAATAAGTIGVVSGVAAPGYVFQPGDQLHYGGTVGGGTAGAYNITGYVGGIIYLEGTIPGIAPGNMDVRGIGKMVEVNENFALNPVASMDEAAVRYTDALRKAGLINACVHWEWTTFTSYLGQFTITCTDGGPKAGFNAAYCIQAPTISPAVADTAFAATPTVTAGTGAWEDFTTTPRDRWLAVTAPDQPDAVLDGATMPVSLRKIDTTSYAITTLDLGAWHYWRLGDDTTNNTAKDSAGHSLGTYTNAPTRGVTGFVTGDTDTATTFDGTNDYVAVTTWQALGDQSAVTVEMLVKTTTAAIGERCMFHMRQINDLYVTMTKTAANRITVYAGGGEYRCDVTGFNSGALKHLVVVATATGVRVEVNGTAQVVTTVSDATGNPGIAAENVAYTINIGRRIDASMYFAGTLDEVAVYPFAFAAATATSASLASWRNSQATGTTTELWTVEKAPWEPRLTGNPITNPVPSFITNGLTLTASAVWQGRLGVGAGRTASFSRAQKETAFFVENVDILTDAAPIDRIVAGTDASAINGLTTFGSICFAKTDGPTHYELSAAGPLAIGTLNSRAGLSRDLSSTLPVLAGERLYLLGPADGAGGGRTLMESTLNEQAVQASYDDVGQHFHGRIDTAGTASFELVAIPTDGKVLAVQIGSGNIYVYQTAYVGDEKRQSAWAPWAIGGTIKAACAVDGGLAMIVLRGANYLLEFWEPQSPNAWPTASARMDGLVTLTGGVFAAGNTTWTTPTNVPATGIDRIVTAAGVEHTVTGTGSTVTLAGVNLNGQTVTAGRWFASTVKPSRPFVRDGNQQAVISRAVTPSHAIVTATDVRKVRCLVTVDSRAQVDYPISPLKFETTIGRAWTRGPSGRTVVELSMPGVAPVSIGTIEHIMDSQGSRT